MIVSAVTAAFRQLASPALRLILLRSLMMTAGMLFAIWLLLTQALRYFLQNESFGNSIVFFDPLVMVLAGAGLFFVLAYFIPAIAAVVASFYIDEAAEIVERNDFPGDPPGQEISFGQSFLYGLRFALLSLLLNLFALAFFLVPVINVLVFFTVNAYLLGREYFELSAMRFRSRAQAVALRRRYAVTIWLAGGTIAALILIPIVNLVAPLFGIALMVHLHKRLAADAASTIEVRFMEKPPAP